MNLKRKIEHAFVAYLQTIDDLDGLTIVPGSSADVEEFPILIVHCRHAAPEADLPPGVREYEAELVVQLITQSDDDEIAPESDDRLSALDDAMRDQTAIKAAMNAPSTLVDPDPRAVQELHVKAIFDKDQDGAVEGRHFIDSLEYELHVCDFDDPPNTVD
jgi:hypothetical protein